MIMSSPYLTVYDAADYLGVSVRRVQQFAKEERIGEKQGRDWFFTREELREFKRAPRKPGRPKQNE
jgi:excisionase family DNA binding protein